MPARHHLLWRPRSVAYLLAEEGALKLPGLRGRESWLREHLDSLIGDLPLLSGKRRRVSIPAHTSADVRVNPRALTRDLTGQSMQLLDLLEQRLELAVIDRHDGSKVLVVSVGYPGDETALGHGAGSTR
jgi:hypothetical protein